MSHLFVGGAACVLIAGLFFITPAMRKRALRRLASQQEAGRHLSVAQLQQLRLGSTSMPFFTVASLVFLAVGIALVAAGIAQ